MIKFKYFLIFVAIMLLSPAFAVEPVVVKRQIPKPLQVETQKDTSSANQTSQLTSQQRLTKIKQYTNNYVKSVALLDLEDMDFKYCDMVRYIEGLGGSKVLQERFLTDYKYSQSEISNGIKLGNNTFRNAKKCVIVTFEFEEKPYKIAWCK